MWITTYLSIHQMNLFSISKFELLWVMLLGKLMCKCCVIICFYGYILSNTMVDLIFEKGTNCWVVRTILHFPRHYAYVSVSPLAWQPLFSVFGDSYPSRWEVESCFGFPLCVSESCGYLASFHVLIGCLYISLGEMFIHILCHFKNCFFKMIELQEFFLSSSYKPHVRYMICKHFLLFVWFAILL